MFIMERCNIPPKFKYSYMNETGQWVHLCDCGTSGELTSVGNFDKSNGFTNCNCANSQYINVTYPIESDTYQCRIIDSECWKKGNYWYSSKMDPSGEALEHDGFWRKRPKHKPM